MFFVFQKKPAYTIHCFGEDAPFGITPLAKSGHDMYIIQNFVPAISLQTAHNHQNGVGAESYDCLGVWRSHFTDLADLPAV